MLTLTKRFKLVCCFLLFVNLLVKAVMFLSVDGIDGCQNIRAILLIFLQFCCFDFDPKISTECIDSVYNLFLFKLSYGTNDYHKRSYFKVFLGPMKHEVKVLGNTLKPLLWFFLMALQQYKSLN